MGERSVGGVKKPELLILPTARNWSKINRPLNRF
jgi:hypothetical protein